MQTGGFGDPNGVPARESKSTPGQHCSVRGLLICPPDRATAMAPAGQRAFAAWWPAPALGAALLPATAAASNTRACTCRKAALAIRKRSRWLSFVRSKRDDAAGKMVPAEVISKPTPAYTAEARNLRIEGEVVLEVVFEASGKLRVLRVVQGLGHGLDEIRDACRRTDSLQTRQTGWATVRLHRPGAYRVPAGVKYPDQLQAPRRGFPQPHAFHRDSSLILQMDNRS